MRWESGFFLTAPQPWQTRDSFARPAGNSIILPPALSALRRRTETNFSGARTRTDPAPSRWRGLRYETPSQMSCALAAALEPRAAPFAEEPCVRRREGAGGQLLRHMHVQVVHERPPAEPHGVPLQRRFGEFD